MRKLGLVSFVIIVVCVMAGAAFAEPVVLVRMKGTVEVMLGNSEAWVKALPDVELREGDRLRTAEDGKAELFFPEETLLLIREHSEIRITAEGEGGGGSIQAIIGGILVNIRGSLSPGSKFEVDGSSALAVVRGTVFAG